jgi:CheY-like chemotaxis protein
MTSLVYGPRLEDAAFDDARDEARDDGASDRPTSALPHAPTIVVVDDDAVVRAAMRRTLEPFGYDVVEAADGVDAIGAVRERSGNVALVITDVVMWRMGGGELSACLAALYPRTRVLFMSGYREDMLRRKGLMPIGGAFVAKPLEPDALASRVRKLLDGA